MTTILPVSQVAQYVPDPSHETYLVRVFAPYSHTPRSWAIIRRDGRSTYEVSRAITTETLARIPTADRDTYRVAITERVW